VKAANDGSLTAFVIKKNVDFLIVVDMGHIEVAIKFYLNSVA
jgi:hypothetical protein